MNGYNFSNATDIRLGSSTITALYYGSTLIWPKTTPPTPPTPTDWSTEYLQVEALEPLTLTNNRLAPGTNYSNILDIQYSVDKVNWNTWYRNISISMQTGDIVYFKGSYAYVSGDYALSENKLTTNTNNSIKIKGNIMSLIYGDNFVGQTSLSGYSYCFADIFYGLKIVDASNIILPATSLAQGCYYGMFDRCASLTTAPELPATTLAISCYSGMFQLCTSLTTAPELPATSLATYCYTNMFNTCRSLTTAPELLATTLQTHCYDAMFENCTSLTTAPDLPATTLVDYCYQYMFAGCTLLNYIKCLATNKLATDCTRYWVRNVAATGTFVKDANTRWGTGVDAIPSGWTVQDPSTEYLQVEAIEPMTLTTSMPVSKTTNDVLDVQYSTDKTNWNAWNEDVSLSLSTGDKVYFKGSYLSTFTKINSTNSYSAKYALCNGPAGTSYNVRGNIMSLIYGDNFANQYSLQDYTYCFYKLFINNKSITDMSNLILPATTLAAFCYSNMFNGCTLLTTAPELPATTLAKSCYVHMFWGCYSLTTAPALPATTLEDYCYSNMFNACVSLTTAPALPATTLKNNCYVQMFQACRLLTTAPELPATKLLYRCYNNMFNGCTALNYIKCLATDMTALNCLTDWVKNVAATGTFVKDANTTWSSGTSGIPADWTVQDM